MLGDVMTDIRGLIEIEPYSLDKRNKRSLMTEFLAYLTQHHYSTCEPYRNILNAISFKNQEFSSATEFPFLPVRLFKEIDLMSTPRNEVVKTMTSSGTTGQAVSRIYLDRQTSANQTKVLVKIVSSFIGAQRLPMLIIDSPAVVKDRAMFSARGAGIIGFSLFATDKAFALNDNMELDYGVIDSFLQKHQGKRILLFGFTFMIWQHFYKELLTAGKFLDLSNGILIHGGGWKKLVTESITSKEFRKRIFEVCGIARIHDYYGMVEQTGSIFMECEQGHLHASIFSDVIVRRPFDFTPAAFGEKGIIEVVSVLPHSYPGHALLTEDQGIIHGEDDCPCGRLGKYFSVLGRLENAEIRGCSDTYAAQFA